MKKRILSIVLTMVMLLSAAAAINVSAAEKEVVGGKTGGTATKVVLDTEYFVEVVLDEGSSRSMDYFTFTTDKEGFYEVIAMSNEDTFKMSILTAGERELGYEYFNKNGEQVLGKKLDANEKYLIKVVGDSYNTEGRYFFRINYKADSVADNIGNAYRLTANRKVESQLEGVDDVDWYTFTNTSNSSKKIKVTFANTTGDCKYAEVFNESEESMRIIQNGRIGKGSTVNKEFTIEANQQIFIKVAAYSDYYAIGDNGYYVLISGEGFAEVQKPEQGGENVNEQPTPLPTDGGGFSPTPGTVINEVLHTDIKAFIDDCPIRSYNIDGYTAVMAEDLVNYGFRVVYKDATRSLYIDEGNKKVTSTYEHVENTYPVGAKAMDVYATNITTYSKGYEIPGYNIDGSTIVFLKDLTAFGKLHWLPEKRVAAFYRYDYTYGGN